MSLNVIDDYLTEDQVAEVLGIRQGGFFKVSLNH